MTFILLITILPVVLATGCEKASSDEEPVIEPEEPKALPDSVLLVVRLLANPDSVRTADYFIYSGSGTKRLEKHIRTDRPEPKSELTVTAGNKTVVVVLNSPYAFNLAALDRLDSFSLFEFSLRDDDPSYPLMTTRCDAEAGSTVELKPVRLLCSVRIAAVSNNLGGDILLEEPRVRLTGVNAKAKVMQTADFRPVEVDEYGEWVPLPYDVGFFTQRPGTALFCYPNDTPEDVLGSLKTGLQLECRINGEKRLFDFGLPPLPRACCIDVELTIESADYARCSILTARSPFTATDTTSQPEESFQQPDGKPVPSDKSQPEESFQQPDGKPVPSDKSQPEESFQQPDGKPVPSDKRLLEGLLRLAGKF